MTYSDSSRLGPVWPDEVVGSSPKRGNFTSIYPERISGSSHLNRFNDSPDFIWYWRSPLVLRTVLKRNWRSQNLGVNEIFFFLPLRIWSEGITVQKFPSTRLRDTNLCPQLLWVKGVRPVREASDQTLVFNPDLCWPILTLPFNDSRRFTERDYNNHESLRPLKS